MISPRWKYFNKLSSSELLRKDGSSPLLNNFQRFLKLKKSEHDDRQQDLYTAVLCRPLPARYDIITLTHTDNTEVTVDPEPLFSCVRRSRIPIRDIKTIKAKLWYGLTEWMWDVFSILTSGVAVIQKIKCLDDICMVYSPVIHDLIQQGKLEEWR